jgi:hypothetical protein
MLLGFSTFWLASEYLRIIFSEDVWLCFTKLQMYGIGFSAAGKTVFTTKIKL